VRLRELVGCSEAVAATRSRTDKVARLAACLGALAPEEVAFGMAALSGLPPERLGVGPAALREAANVAAAAEPTLTLGEVAGALAALGALGGRGSARARAERLAALFARATREEQRFLAGWLAGGLRQGAAQGLVLEALARAGGATADAVRRAVALAGALAPVAEALLGGGPGARGGADALARFELQLFRPLRPMLAQPADDVAAVLAALGEAALEWKLDGARVQVHKAGDEVRVFSRRMNEVGDSLPEVIEAVRALPVRSAVLDGEAIALRPDGAPQPFQVTMRRFGRRQDDPALRRALPLSVFFFDCLHLDGEDLIDKPARERLDALDGRLPAAVVVPRLVTTDPGAAQAFLDDALARGHEGVMVKSLAAPYEAGRRGAGWLKVKPAHTLDLVVLAAEWGHGRRTGKLSNLHLGARDPTGGFVMLGKTFKGMSDEMLAWQTEHLLGLETSRDGHVVHVRPELVVEIAFDGVQRSSRYPGGMALRFARVKGYRPDKSAAEADSVEAVRDIHTRAE
jgi:DNA ligase-1